MKKDAHFSPQYPYIVRYINELASVPWQRQPYFLSFSIPRTFVSVFFHFPFLAFSALLSSDRPEMNVSPKPHIPDRIRAAFHSVTRSLGVSLLVVDPYAC